MKKYIAPEVEIKKFNVENIMAESGVTVSGWDGTAAGVDNSASIDYDKLFTIQ